MTSGEATHAADLIDEKRGLKNHLANVEHRENMLTAGYKVKSDGRDDIYAFPLDQQGIEQLKPFIKGCLNRRILEIEVELAKLGIEEPHDPTNI